MRLAEGVNKRWLCADQRASTSSFLNIKRRWLMMHHRDDPMHPLGFQVRCSNLGLSPNGRHSLAWLYAVDGTCKGGEAQNYQHQSNHLCWLVPNHPPFLGCCRCLKFHIDRPIFHAFLLQTMCNEPYTSMFSKAIRWDQLSNRRCHHLAMSMASVSSKATSAEWTVDHDAVTLVSGSFRTNRN